MNRNGRLTWHNRDDTDARKYFEALQAAVDTEKARAEKAEQKRDSWESIAQQTARSIEALRAEQPRALTADDITDAMIERAQDEHKGYTGQPLGTWVARAVLTAALTEPPTRPEGAEGWQEELGEMPAASDLTPEQRERLADALAERDHALRLTGAES